MSFGLVEEPTLNGGFGEAICEGITKFKLRCDVTSEFASDNLSQFKNCHCDTNKKVIGIMKPEYVNDIIIEFIGLRSKM